MAGDLFARRLGIFRELDNPAFREFLYREAIMRMRLRADLRRLTMYHKGVSSDFHGTTTRYLANIVEFARSHSPFYRERLDGLPQQISPRSRSWLEVPVIDRDTVRRQEHLLMTVPSDCGYLRRLTTGGSTGEPLSLAYLGGHDGDHQEFVWRLHGYTEGDTILALDGTVVPAELRRRNIYWIEKGLHDLPYGSLALSSHYFNDKTARYYVDFIRSLKPAFLRGYPSFIYSLAKHLDHVQESLRVKSVQLTSESHFPHQVQLIERVFGPCIDQYGHAEAALFAYSAPNSERLHCAPTYGLVEILDDTLSGPVPAGVSGEVVVTGFHNYAMPLIRYRTGDRAISGGIENGIAMIETVEGRAQDIVYSRDGSAHRLTALVFGRHYEAFANIRKWQLVQKEPGQILVLIEKGKNYASKDEQELRDNFKRIAGIDCEFEYVSWIPPTMRGKAKFLVQSVEQ